MPKRSLYSRSERDIYVYATTVERKANEAILSDTRTSSREVVEGVAAAAAAAAVGGLASYFRRGVTYSYHCSSHHSRMWCVNVRTRVFVFF